MYIPACLHATIPMKNERPVFEAGGNFINDTWVQMVPYLVDILFII